MVRSSTTAARGLFAATLVAALGACDLVLGIPDRTVGPHLSCADGECVCTGGYVDCDDDPKNGCETSPGSDPKHCGACGHECLGGDCVEGRCAPFELLTFGYPQAISVSGDKIYVTLCGMDPPVLEVPIDGAGARPLVLNPDCGLYQANTGEVLFWSNGGTIFASSLSVVGPPKEVIATGAPLQGIAAGGAHLYWTIWDKNTMAGGVFRMALPQGAPSQIANLEPRSIAADAERAYWSDAAGLHAIAHDASTIVDLPGGTHLGAIRVSGDTLHAMDNALDAPGIIAVPLTGGAPSMVAPGAATFGFGVSGGTLYWLDYLDGNVWEQPLAGGEKRLLAEGHGYATNSDVAFHPEAIYWLSDQSLYKMAR